MSVYTDNLRKLHYMHKIDRLNKRLDIIELEVMKFMRMGSWSAEAFVEVLVNERENIRNKIEDLNKRMNGQ